MVKGKDTEEICDTIPEKPLELELLKGMVVMASFGEAQMSRCQ